jgi:hypothetical protein
VAIEQIDLPGLSIAAGCATAAQGEPLGATMAKADAEMYRQKKRQKDLATEPPR